MLPCPSGVLLCSPCMQQRFLGLSLCLRDKSGSTPRVGALKGAGEVWVGVCVYSCSQRLKLLGGVNVQKGIVLILV